MKTDDTDGLRELRELVSPKTPMDIYRQIDAICKVARDATSTDKTLADDVAGYPRRTDAASEALRRETTYRSCRTRLWYCCEAVIRLRWANPRLPSVPKWPRGGDPASWLIRVADALANWCQQADRLLHRPRLVVDVERETITADGEVHAVGRDAAVAIRELLVARGGWRIGNTLLGHENGRTDRALKNVRAKLPTLIESRPGGGYRIREEWLPPR